MLDVTNNPKIEILWRNGDVIYIQLLIRDNMSSLTPGPNDENGVHHHQNSRKTPILSRSNQCQSESVGMDESGGGGGHLISSSLGSQSQDSLNNEQPRNKLLGKWHRNISFGWKLFCVFILKVLIQNNNRKYFGGWKYHSFCKLNIHEQGFCYY